MGEQRDSSGQARRPSDAERTRTLVASRAEGALCTLAREPAGHPYGSHVLYAAVGVDPVFLISRLAEHTKNLEADPRASLLVTAASATAASATAASASAASASVGGGGGSLAHARVTLLGRCERLPEGDRARAEGAFLAAHPDARMYAGFSDFSYWRLHVRDARFIAGFGRMSWIGAEELERAEPDPLWPHAAGVLEHMNDDHADACLAYARAHGCPEATSAVMTAVDRYGFELRVVSEDGERPLRLSFSAEVGTPNEVRVALVSMVRQARAKLG